jgi:hypothetical protein
MTYLTPEVVTDWIIALRSDQYPQGQTQLRSMNDKYCCLGVLCDVLHRTRNVGEWRKMKHWWFLFRNSIGGMAGSDPMNDVYLMGDIGREFSYLFNQPTVNAVFIEYIKHNNGLAEEEQGRFSRASIDLFIRLNDAMRVPFPVIADLLTTALPHITFKKEDA